MRIKMKLRGLFASALLALTMAAPTQSFAITNVLYMTMDGSGSISNTDWDLQVNGYVNALNAVIDSNFYGDIAIGVSVFGGDYWAGVGDVNEVFSLQLISNATDLAALTTAISNTLTGGSNQRAGISTSATAIGDAINAAATAINTFGLGTNNVIDVSTDGGSNIGANPITAANAALAGGISTNCLGIGTSANCSFATGFSANVANFADFEAAMISKLERELNAPEPGIAVLMAMGLLGMGFVRRRHTT